jgi:hypothetical protein
MAERFRQDSRLALHGSLSGAAEDGDGIGQHVDAGGLARSECALDGGPHDAQAESPGLAASFSELGGARRPVGPLPLPPDR